MAAERLGFRCPDCGPDIAADEDGCCAVCGIDCTVEPSQLDAKGAAFDEVRAACQQWNKLPLMRKDTAALAHQVRAIVNGYEKAAAPTGDIDG